MTKSRKIIQTDDGTYTIYMDDYNQAMHTTSGAYNESILKHIGPSKILENELNEINILDIGFGVGYNVLAAIYEIDKNESKSKYNIISLEKEKDFSEMLGNITFNDERDDYYKTVIEAYEKGESSYKNINIKIHFDDARKTVKQFTSEKFDTIFQDAFSPYHNPELWSFNFFKELARIIKKEGLLTTYSSAPQIRKALVMSGFHISRGPSVGNKREGTIASLKMLDEKNEIEILDEISNNIKSEPYIDQKLNSSREEILMKRQEKIQKKRKQIL